MSSDLLGAIIVGSVDGNRLWGKELQLELHRVEWSPDGRFLLFGAGDGTVHIYDSSGQFVGKMSIFVPNQSQGPSEERRIAALEWYDGAEGFVDPFAPTLALCYENGMIQLTRSETDESPILIDTGLVIRAAKWNSNGSVLAVAGSIFAPPPPVVPPTPLSPPAANALGSPLPTPPSTAPKEFPATQVVQFYSPFGKVWHYSPFRSVLFAL